jgi:hypothetical protein
MPFCGVVMFLVRKRAKRERQQRRDGCSDQTSIHTTVPSDNNSFTRRTPNDRIVALPAATGKFTQTIFR